MKTICFSLLLTASSLLANPCDGNTRIGQNGVGMACSLAAPVVLDPAALDMAAHSTLNLVVTATTPSVDVLAVEVGYISVGRRQRKTVHFQRSFTDSLKTAATIDLPVGVTIEFVQIDEFTRSNSAGFVQ